MSITVGVGVAGLVGGLLVGIASAVFFLNRRQHKQRQEFQALDMMSPTITPYSSTPGGQFQRHPSASSGDPLLHGHSVQGSLATDYHVEPFAMPRQHRNSQGQLSPDTTEDGSAGSSKGKGRGQVYVVHHDGGRAPVTVYHADGQEVSIVTSIKHSSDI